MPPETPSTPPGRNEPCHCGSGRKYKHCCLEKDEAAARASRARAQEAAPPAEASAPAEGGEKRHEPAQRRAAPPQPWKRAQTSRGTPRFQAPRKVGGS